MPDEEEVYVAGRFIAPAEATVAANDASLLLGVGLFETLRTYGGRPFRIEAHLARMRESGRFLRVLVRESDDDIRRIVGRLIETSGLADARVRLTATRGPLAGELDDDAAPPATLIIMAGPMTPYPAHLYDKGATVVVSDIRANETDPATYHKTTGYLTNLLALRDAHRAGATEAILFNTKNRLAEAAVSNVFIVKGGRLLTPPVEDGLLAGITRAAVLDLAAETGVPAEQESLSVRDFLDADEVFLTNSIMELLPVARVERREIGAGRPGPVWRKLADAYRALVTRETSGS